MNETEKIEILREQIASLRGEVVRYSDSQRMIARYAVVGVAAIAALRKDLSIAQFEAFLPIIPILGMGLIAILVLENAFIFRAGRWLAAAERQLNAIAKEDFLQYEQSVRTWRTKWLTYGWVPVWMFLLAAAAAYGWSILYLFSFSELATRPGIVFVIEIFAVIAFVFAAVYFIRMIGELRAGVPTLPPVQALVPTPSQPTVPTSAVSPLQPPMPPVPARPAPPLAPPKQATKRR